MWKIIENITNGHGDDTFIKKCIIELAKRERRKNLNQFE